MKNHIYILNTEKLDNEELFQQYYKKMHQKRRKKIDRYRFRQDKLLSLGAGILLSEGLAREGITDFKLEYGNNNKPFLVGVNNVYFNLSHSGKMVTIAFSDRPVGVDIEIEQEFRNSLAKMIFKESESAYILKNSTNHNAAFTKLWTIKESVMKLLGTGLSLEPNQITIDLHEPICAVCEGYASDYMHFTQYEISGYALTVCSEYDNFASEVEEILPDITTY